MKSYLVITIILLFGVSYCVGQFSFGAGYTMPIGAHKDLQKGTANPGYQLAISWDKELKEKLGFTSILLLEQNKANENSINHFSGKWSHATLGVGSYIEPVDKLKIKGLLTAGLYRSPNFLVNEIGSIVIDIPGIPENPDSGEIQTFTTSTYRGFRLNAFALGFSFRVEYSIGHFFIGSNFNYARPDFARFSDGTLDIEIHSITSLGILAGFTF